MPRHNSSSPQRGRGRPKNPPVRSGGRGRPKKGSIPKCIKRKKDKIYCGDKNYLPSSEYKRFGSRQECLRSGFGAGMYSERDKIKKQLKSKKIKFSFPKTIPYCD